MNEAAEGEIVEAVEQKDILPGLRSGAKFKSPISEYPKPKSPLVLATFLIK
jgi:hypothetical protein